MLKITNTVTLFRPQSQSSPTSTMPLPHMAILDRRTIVFLTKKEK